MHIFIIVDSNPCCMDWVIQCMSYFCSQIHHTWFSNGNVFVCNLDQQYSFINMWPSADFPVNIWHKTVSKHTIIDSIQAHYLFKKPPPPMVKGSSYQNLAKPFYWMKIGQFSREQYDQFFLAQNWGNFSLMLQTVLICVQSNLPDCHVSDSQLSKGVIKPYRWQGIHLCTTGPSMCFSGTHPNQWFFPPLSLHSSFGHWTSILRPKLMLS